MLVKMFGKLWKVIGTDPATGEPIYEPADAPLPVAAAPVPAAPTPEPEQPLPLPVETAPEAPKLTPHVRTVSTAKGKDRRDKPYYANRGTTAIPDVVGKQVESGKSLTPVSDRSAGPIRRPDGSIIPPLDPARAGDPLGCSCTSPCFCANPPGYLAPWEKPHSEPLAQFDEGGEISNSALDEALDADLYKQGKKFGSALEKPVIVRRFGKYAKMVGYDEATGEPTYEAATQEEIIAAQEEIIAAAGEMIEIEGRPARTPSVGSAEGWDNDGKSCKSERIPLDFKRYGITARPSRGPALPPMTEDQVRDFKRATDAMDKELGG